MKIFISTSASREDIAKGSRVAARIKGSYYLGTVSSRSADGAQVSFDDGDKHSIPYKALTLLKASTRKIAKALTKAEVEAFKEKATTKSAPTSRATQLRKIRMTRASDDDWLAYWKDEQGKYKTKVIAHPSDVQDIVKALYKKYNTFYNVGSIKRSEWKKYKSSFI